MVNGEKLCRDIRDPFHSEDDVGKPLLFRFLVRQLHRLIGIVKESRAARVDERAGQRSMKWRESSGSSLQSLHVGSPGDLLLFRTLKRLASASRPSHPTYPKVGLSCCLGVIDGY